MKQQTKQINILLQCFYSGGDSNRAKCKVCNRANEKKMEEKKVWSGRPRGQFGWVNREDSAGGVALP